MLLTDIFWQYRYIAVSVRSNLTKGCIASTKNELTGISFHEVVLVVLIHTHEPIPVALRATAVEI